MPDASVIDLINAVRHYISARDFYRCLLLIIISDCCTGARKSIYVESTSELANCNVYS